MIPSIERLLVLQDRDQKLRTLRLELKNLPAERTSLEAKLAVGAAQLEAAKQRGTRYRAGKEEARTGCAGQARLHRQIPHPAISDAQERGIPGADERDQALRRRHRKDRGSRTGTDGGRGEGEAGRRRRRRRIRAAKIADPAPDRGHRSQAPGYRFQVHRAGYGARQAGRRGG